MRSVISAIVASLSLVAFGTVPAAEPRGAVQLAQAPIDYLRARPPSGNLVDVYDVTWLGSGAIATLEDNRNVRFALIAWRPVSNWAALNANSCAVMFKIAARKANSSISVDRIVADVIAYTPPPKYAYSRPLPLVMAPVDYLEISPPDSGNSSFHAERLTAAARRASDEAFLMLDPGKPETITVMINATAPGLYTFSLTVFVSHGAEQEAIVLVPRSTWLFGRR